MIRYIWKPIYKKINKKSIIQHYELIDDYYDLKKGWKVMYTCDVCESNKINQTTTSVLLNSKIKFNTILNQTCRSCRSHISEYIIKKNFIPYDLIRESIINSGYIVNTRKYDYDKSKKKSQFKFDVICSNGHDLQVTWNNWSKGRRCRKCYNEKRIENAVNSKDGWDLYLFNVWKITEKNYKQYKSYINPNGYLRGREYHLDHKFSISEGFRNGILPHVIGGVENLEILPSYENNSKGSKCSVSINDIVK